ncbi:MAG: leucyl/phenylalanyl-tRNA--protein transferase, partial [Desulfatitalea sp.]|nr:leucyl/phenylalanyl-tRNA--protein transferase [Desulfatitalea sp.]
MPVYRLTEQLLFPPVHLANPDGLLAVGGDLSPERLLLAYKLGIFPWYTSGSPILWWSPDPRMVLFLGDLRISRNLKKVLRKKQFDLSVNRSFREVIRACALTRLEKEEGTWITPKMVEAYCQLNKMGYAHSIEVWHMSQLVGGCYGIALGHCFFGESMFSIMDNASKVALVHLVEVLNGLDFLLIDCQVPSDHLE